MRENKRLLTSLMIASSRSRMLTSPSVNRCSLLIENWKETQRRVDFLGPHKKKKKKRNENITYFSSDYSHTNTHTTQQKLLKTNVLPCILQHRTYANSDEWIIREKHQLKYVTQ